MISSTHSSFFSTATVTAVSPNRLYLYLTICTANLLELCAGVAIAWSSPFVAKLTDEDNMDSNPFGRPLTKSEVSWIGSLLALGAMFGTWFAGVTAAKIGRKKSLLLTSGLPAISSHLLLLYGKTVYVFYIARLLGGIGVGGAYTILPMYSGEIAEDSIRGLICSSVSTFEVIGELIAYVVGPFLTIGQFSSLILAIAMLGCCLIMIIVPESPYYLVSINKMESAEKSLITLRSTVGPEIHRELQFIHAVIEESKTVGTIIDIFKSKALVKAQIITLSLAFFQNCSGIIPVLFYSQTIFDESGSSLPPAYSAMSIGIVQFVGSLVTPGIIDKFQRRTMLRISSFGMCITEGLLGLYFFLRKHGHTLSAFFWLPVTCLVSYIMFYIIGFGPLVWTIIGEIFPNDMKPAAVSLTLWFWWTLAFLLSRFFKPIGDLVGMEMCFWAFSVNCFFAALFVSCYLIETRGKTLQEIQHMLSI